MKKPDNVVLVPGSYDTFFRTWFEFLRPFHTLTERECDVAAAFVKLRWELSHSITDSALLDQVLMSNDSKKKVREMCDITLQHFQVIMSKLKKNNFIVEGKINPRFIPNITEDADSFKLLVYFKLK